MKIDTRLPQPAEVPASIAPVSLADLKSFVEAHPDLSDRQRRDLASAIQSLASYLGIPAANLPADGRHLRFKIERLHHAQLGVSKKRLDNVIGGLRQALRLASQRFPGARYRGHRDPAWQALRESLPAKSKYIYHLSRFITFCSQAGIAPDQVTDATFEGYFNDLRAHSSRKDPRPPYRAACAWWNRASADIPGWPQIAVSVPSFKTPPKTRPLCAFPESFSEDLEACRDQLTSSNPFRHKTRRRRDGKRHRRSFAPYQAATMDSYTKKLHRAASVLVDTGTCALAEVTGLAVLCESANAEAILAHYWTAAGEQATSYTKLLATVLKIVAEVYLEADDAQLDDLSANVVDMTPGEGGLTEKNRERLRQFNEPANKLLLLEAPRVLRQSAEAKGVRRKRDAVDLMVAAATAILLYAPVRLQNLTGISLSKNWIAPNAKGIAGLHFAKEEVKNNVELVFPVPAEVVEIVHAYMEQARHWWLSPTDDQLFPFGGDKAARAHFGDLISQRLRRVTGLRINVHLFRHICAKFYLDANPGQYEVVRLLLGHKDLSTTVRNYCGLEREAAIAHYDATVLGLRETLKADTGTTARQRRNRRRQAPQQKEG